MVNAKLTEERTKNAEKIASAEKRSGVKLRDCYQCGKCSAGCPMAHAMDLSPRQVIRHLQLGMWDEVLHSKTIWLCATCSTCYERCPQSVDLPALMEVMRQEAKAAKIRPIPELDKFNDIFLKNVEMFGKSHEMVLSGLYNLTSGHLTQDVPNAPHLYFKKLIRIRPHLSKDRAGIKKMMRKARSGGVN